MEVVETFLSAHPILFTCINAVIIIVATWIVDRIATKVVRKLLHSSSTVVPASSIFVNIIRAFVWIIGIAVLLRVCFNYDAAGFVAALGVGGIAFSLGCQDTLSNLIGGLQVSLGQLAKPGDYIEVLGQKGRVKDINWRETKIEDDSGVQYLVPNSLMNKNVLTQLGNAYSVSVPFAIPIDSDIASFSAKAKKAITANVGSKTDADSIHVHFTGEKSNGIEGTISATSYRKVISQHALIDAIVRSIDPLVKQAYAKSALYMQEK